MKTRADRIKWAGDMGFNVVSEVGMKDPPDKVALDLMHKEIVMDLDCRAFKVIVEASLSKE